MFVYLIIIVVCILQFTFDDDEFAADYATHDDTTDEYDEE